MKISPSSSRRFFGAAIAALFLYACADETAAPPPEAANPADGTAVDDPNIASNDTSPDEGSGDVPAGAEVPAASAILAHEGDTITAAEGVGAIVPAIGGRVMAIAEMDDGSSQTLIVTNDEATGVHAESSADAAVTANAEASSTELPACSDSAHNLMGHHWNKAVQWKFRSGTTPTTNSKSNVENALKLSAANISLSHNNCGTPKADAPAETYLGRTTLHTQVIGNTTTYKCGQGDGHNVVGFGVLPHPVVGLTCVWSGAGNVATEADIKLNDHDVRWFAGTSVPSGCHNSVSVESVATHEFGHLYGLAHVSRAADGNQTMFPVTNMCSVSAASLGKGDVLGLHAIYGP